MNDLRTTLIDEALPRFDFGSRHRRHIAASPDAVWRALESVHPSRDASLPVRLLFRLRGVPVPRGTFRDVLTASKFAVLAERPGSELLTGTTGRFWALRELDNMKRPADLDAFREFDRPGWAKAVLYFRAEPLPDGSTTLITETRVACVDDAARHRFAAYWRIINFFSGWIRREMLRGVARHAEGAA